jgi:hypothetical protein
MELTRTKLRNQNWALGSRSGDFKEYYILGSDAVSSGKISTFLRNVKELKVSRNLLNISKATLTNLSL